MGTVMGLKGRSTEITKEALDNIKETKDFASSGKYAREDSDIHRKQKQVEIVSTVEQGTTRDSALPMAKLVGDAERPTTSRQ